MIYVTADLHGQVDIDKITMKKWPIQKELTRDDYLIVCGDFGLLWHKDKTYQYLLDFYTSRKYTLLWVDGNHCNHDWLINMPISTWHGGKVHMIGDNIIHLNIDGYKFIAIGGAKSIDKAHRTEFIDWWSQEEMCFSEQQHVLNKLDEYNWEVDYVLSHAAPRTILRDIFPNEPQLTGTSNTEKFLAHIHQYLSFKQWYFGHYHLDRDLGKYHCLYNRVVSLII